MYIDMGILVAIILTPLAIILFGLILMVILKLNDVLKQVKDQLSRNEKNIDDSLRSLPKVLHNLEEITYMANEEMKHVHGAIKNIEETVGYAAATAQMVSEDIVEPIGDVLQLLSILRGIFVKEKKKGLFK
ncbi:hypothetical protein [Alkaliphilus peptidifermentans]|uniref:DUF948 domain-containing protein n=1 Tax=Alkaliphilus peptidifermentans DSM 18978 TaxID=1120976 RepID=A0A1G5HR00_9FIRM|nr:hypothetical protein [Alkaliphilus peptidifermentans]SCY65458.1 hypothetical protein SAMN03080606_02067 [Alkaliphilus peptidifermentans DSM 18978]